MAPSSQPQHGIRAYKGNMKSKLRQIKQFEKKTKKTIGKIKSLKQKQCLLLAKMDHVNIRLKTNLINLKHKYKIHHEVLRELVASLECTIQPGEAVGESSTPASQTSSYLSQNEHYSPLNLSLGMVNSTVPTDNVIPYHELVVSQQQATDSDSGFNATVENFYYNEVQFPPLHENNSLAEGHGVNPCMTDNKSVLDNHAVDMAPVACHSWLDQQDYGQCVTSDFDETEDNCMDSDDASCSEDEDHFANTASVAHHSWLDQEDCDCEQGVVSDFDETEDNCMDSDEASCSEDEDHFANTASVARHSWLDQEDCEQGVTSDFDETEDSMDSEEDIEEQERVNNESSDDSDNGSERNSSCSNYSSGEDLEEDFSENKESCSPNDESYCNYFTSDLLDLAEDSEKSDE